MILLTSVNLSYKLATPTRHDPDLLLGLSFISSMISMAQVINVKNNYFKCIITMFSTTVLCHTVSQLFWPRDPDNYNPPLVLIFYNGARQGYGSSFYNFETILLSIREYFRFTKFDSASEVLYDMRIFIYTSTVLLITVKLLNYDFDQKIQTLCDDKTNFILRFMRSFHRVW